MKEPKGTMVALTLQYVPEGPEYAYLGLKVNDRWYWTGPSSRRFDGPWERISNYVGSNHITVVSVEDLAPVEKPAKKPAPVESAAKFNAAQRLTSLTTVADLAALPEKTPIIDGMGDVGVVQAGKIHYHETSPQSFERAIKKYGPLHLLREYGSMTIVRYPTADLRLYTEQSEGLPVEATGSGVEITSSSDFDDNPGI